MAYVPDEAWDRRLEDKLPPSAWDVYFYYCRWRDHTTRYSWKKFEDAGRDLKLKRATNYRAHQILRDKGWIVELEDGRVMPVMGSFKPVNKLTDAQWEASQKRDAKPAANRPKIETGAPNDPNKETPSLKIETESLFIETNRPKIETGAPNDRARAISSISSSPLSSISSKTHTHDLESLPSRAREGDTETRVCVSCGLQFRLEDLERYARNENPPLRSGWINNAWEGCSGHALFGRWLKGQSAPVTALPVRDASTCPDCGGTGFWHPGGPGKGVARCTHLRLAASDSSPPVAEGREAAARSP